MATAAATKDTAKGLGDGIGPTSQKRRKSMWVRWYPAKLSVVDGIRHGSVTPDTTDNISKSFDNGFGSTTQKE